VGSTFARLAVAGNEPAIAVGPHRSLIQGRDPHRTVVSLEPGPLSVLSERLIDRAAMWARAFDHRLTFATVAHGHDVEIAGAGLRRLADDPGLDDLDIETLLLDTTARPHTALVQHLADHPATFLAAATHAPDRAERALLGSETARIIHHSPVPVLVVPPR
jgi:nucleotide-binding universal stress UspA family protein